MENNANHAGCFLSLFIQQIKRTDNNKVKMLTADGKLVEVDKAVLDEAATKTKSLPIKKSTTG